MSVLDLFTSRRDAGRGHLKDIESMINIFMFCTGRNMANHPARLEETARYASCISPFKKSNTRDVLRTNSHFRRKKQICIMTLRSRASQCFFGHHIHFTLSRTAPSFSSLNNKAGESLSLGGFRGVLQPRRRFFYVCGRLSIQS
jgi:hypothetical protein